MKYVLPQTHLCIVMLKSGGRIVFLEIENCSELRTWLKQCFEYFLRAFFPERKQLMEMEFYCCQEKYDNINSYNLPE